MGLEATMVCVDNSEWMRNGDFIPSRLQAQQDAVNVVCRMKTRQNVENTVGLMTLADTQVQVTLTPDQNKIFKALQSLEPKGSINFVTGIRIAHLALKHRQNKNQKMRIVAFIGSPISVQEKDLVKLAKRLKKEKVNVDIVNFGEAESNTEKLTAFIESINGKDRMSRLVMAHPGPLLSDVLLSSPILTDEEGAPLAPLGQGFEFGIDPAEDPELAMALRVSMEEQRQRQDDDTTRMVTQPSTDQQPTTGETAGLVEAGTAELPFDPTFSAMTSQMQDVVGMSEEEQLALALQMSMQGVEGLTEQPMETEGDTGTAEGTEETTQSTEETVDDGEGVQMEELMQNQEFLQSVLSTLPGVNPEQALLSLQEMTQAATTSTTSTTTSEQQQQQQQQQQQGEEEEKEKEKEKSSEEVADKEGDEKAEK